MQHRKRAEVMKKWKLTFESGQDFLGRFAQQGVAEDDRIFSRLGRVDDPLGSGGGSHRSAFSLEQ